MPKLWNAATSCSTPFQTVELQAIGRLGISRGWPAKNSLPPIDYKAHWPAHAPYWAAGARMAADDAAVFRDALLAAWPDVMTWRWPAPHEDRVRTVYVPVNRRVDHDPMSQWDREAVNVESAFGSDQAFASLVRFLALTAVSGEIHVLGVTEDRRAWDQRKPKESPLMLRVRMLRGVISGLRNPSSYGAGETHTLPADLAAPWVADRTAEWLDAPKQKTAESPAGR